MIYLRKYSYLLILLLKFFGYVSLNIYHFAIHSSAASSCWMLKYLIWYSVLLAATTYKNSLNECFFKYFFVKYFKYRFENGTFDSTWILLSVFSIVIWSPNLPILPSTLTLCFRYSAKLEVLNTLSSTGFEQSILKRWLIGFFCYVDLVAFIGYK